MKLIVICNKNTASTNIGKALKSNYSELPDSVKILELDADILDLDKYKKKFDELKPEIIIVLSSHASKANVDSFSVHPTGNFDTNDLGGNKTELSIAPALYLRTGLIGIHKHAKRRGCMEYQITIEATHHSPTFNYLVIFIEIGSNEKAWNDKLAADVLADVVYDLVTKKLEKGISAIGFGGNHYSPKFQKMIETQNYAFGHICPKHKLDNLNDKMILEMINKTIPKPEQAVLDWKGMNSLQRKNIIDILVRNGINWVRA
ncbi:MAG: D-aminoacyl-tRNA deacylase [Nanoarchaeota archaeon]